MTRQAKTPRQRAEEQLATAERTVARLHKKGKQLGAELEAIRRDHDTAVVRRDYLKQHPDLANTQPRPTTSTGDNA